MLTMVAVTSGCSVLQVYVSIKAITDSIQTTTTLQINNLHP